MKRRRFSGLFGPYLELDGDQERAAYTLSFFIRILAAVALTIALMSLLAGLRQAFILSLVGAAAMGLLFLLMRTGHLRATSLLLIVAWQAIAAAALVTGDGIHDVAIVIFPVALITASLLVSRKLYSAMAVLSIIAVAAIGIAEIRGMIETPFSVPDRWGDVFVVSLILVGVALLIRFVTEALHLSLENARRNQQNFREVFNATHEAIIIHDEETGEILDLNDAFLAITGLDRSAALSISAEDLYSDGLSWERIRQTDTAPQETVELDLSVPSGETRRLEMTFQRSIIGGRRCVLVVGRDITDRQRLEGRLRQAEKLQAVGQLAGGIAHDFNNQLVGIVGYADILQMRLDEEPELASYAAKILRSARRASDLTAHLLAFARKGKFRETVVDLHELIYEVVALLERSINKQITITLALKADPSTTSGDPTQLQNCFLNLALNARDAMPDGGDLRFETRNAHLDEEFCRSNPHAIDPGDFVEVSVTDTGVGMSGRVLARIFEPFFTTKEKDKGTGMGLAAVYGTVKNHRGSVNVYSEEGRGTTFRVHLPSAGDSEATRSGDHISLPTPGSSDAHILLVDDEEVVSDTAAEMLRFLGYRVSVAGNGREAIDIYGGAPGDFDLVILDMIMPVMAGGPAFDELKRIDPSVRVLLSSGYSLDGEAQAVLDRGACGFVQKPFLKNELAAAIAGALIED